MSKPVNALLSLFFFCALVGVVYAPDEEVNILNVPQAMGEALGVPEPNTALIGGFFMSIVIFMTAVMPFLLMRNKAPAFLMGLIVFTTLTALNWLPQWLMVLAVLLIASMFASRIKRWVS